MRTLVHERFRQIIGGVANALGCQAEIDIHFLTPAVVNDPAIVQRLEVLFPRIDPGILLERNYRTMGSEDMAYMMREVPGCYFLVGSANSEKGLTFGHHHPRFDFDEAGAAACGCLDGSRGHGLAPKPGMEIRAAASDGILNIGF